VRILDPAEPPARSELLALRALKLGDLLVAVPALKALRRTWPEHDLVLAVPGWLEPIARLVPGVDALLPTPGLDDLLPLAPGRVDIAANLHGNGPESARVIAALEARLAIVHEPPNGPPWVHGMLERERWSRLVSAYGAEADPNDVALLTPERAPVVRGAAVVHPGAFYGSRRWPVERFGSVIRGLRERGHRVVVTGSAAERDRAIAVAAAGGMDESDVLAGRLALDESAAVVAAARILVSADTGAAHLASAYATPSVVLFGPAPASEWGPPPGPHIVLTDASLRRGETFAEEPDPALLAVSDVDVLAAIDRLEVSPS
jgi:ADP-heptose:LPS heptosyltransferase